MKIHNSNSEYNKAIRGLERPKALAVSFPDLYEPTLGVSCPSEYSLIKFLHTESNAQDLAAWCCTFGLLLECRNNKYSIYIDKRACIVSEANLKELVIYAIDNAERLGRLWKA